MIYQNPNYCMGNRSTWQKFLVALRILKNPWMLLFDKLGLVSKPLYFSRTGLKFQTRGKTTDINDAVVVLSGKEYPQELLGLTKDDEQVLVLDCGGHIGSFTMYVKSHWSKVKIVVLEPVPENIELFRTNIQLNQLKDITIVPYALYGQSGTFFIDLEGKQFDAVNITTEKPNHDKFITIEAKTLDEIVASNNIQTIDVMKLDIEGAEYNVFEHSLSALSKHVKRIIMEFHPAGDKAKRDEIVSRLCTDGPFALIYETKNILGFENSQIGNTNDSISTTV